MNHSESTQSTLVQQQFGANAERYVRSRVHAQGQSLNRMVMLAAPEADWLALDVAPGGGHSAMAVAAHVRRVVALDITEAMLQAAREYARRLGRTDIVWVRGDGGRLPWTSATFDLVTCRVALHHFPDQAAAVHEWARVLKPGGRLVLVDNIAPDDAAAETYINTFEKLRDPSHVWMHRLGQLVAFVQTAGLVVEHTERLVKPMQFHAWMERMQVATSVQRELHALLWDSAGAARTFLHPQETETGITFHLHEGIISARRPGQEERGTPQVSWLMRKA